MKKNNSAAVFIFRKAADIGIKILKYTAIVILGTALMFVLNRFLGIPTGVPDTYISFGFPILAAFAAVFGPIAGFLIGFFGHTLTDLTWGEIWWSWVIASAFFGLSIGSFRKLFKIQEGGFKIKQAVYFNLFQAVANVASYIFIARILDLINNEPFDKIFFQGITAAAVNIATVLVTATPLLFAWSKLRGKAETQSADENSKGVARAVGAELTQAMFFVAVLMTLFITELINFQLTKSEAMVIETTESHLKASVQSLAVYVSAEELDLFHTAEDMRKPEYRQIKERLAEFSEQYNVLYAYYERRVGDTIQYIIDNEFDPDELSGPGDFDDSIMEAEYEALAGNISGTDLGTYSPEWEGLLSAFAPVYDSEGNVYCLAGVDVSDEFIFIHRRDARNMKLLQLILIPVAVSFAVLNMLLNRRKAIQIEEAHVKLQYFNNNLRRAFSTYLSEDVVEEIVSDPTRLQLGGEMRHMTALFTDVQSFTTIAEALSPVHLVELLNYYLSTMSDVILEKEGTIDKYEGDAIIAFFGAPLIIPDHAMRACTAAIIMKRLEDDVNRHIMENKLSPSPLLTRIGINSGDMVVGNMGTQKKMNYTIVSNAVNLAARLEGVNKQYGTWVLASEDTVKETGNHFLTRKLDMIRVVGIQEPVRIYEILETTDHASSALQEKIALFHNALALFETHRWVDAGNAFNHILKLFPGDGPSALYLRRCRHFQKDEPAADWDGVFNMNEK